MWRELDREAARKLQCAPHAPETESELPHLREQGPDEGCVAAAQPRRPHFDQLADWCLRLVGLGQRARCRYAAPPWSWKAGGLHWRARRPARGGDKGSTRSRVVDAAGRAADCGGLPPFQFQPRPGAGGLVWRATACRTTRQRMFAPLGPSREARAPTWWGAGSGPRGLPRRCWRAGSAGGAGHCRELRGSCA